jgi:glutathione peroxidase
MIALLTVMAIAPSVFDFSASDIDGKMQPFEKYKGSVVLVVNVASKCGLTKQYTALEALYKKHKSDGLVILGFPCNQFGNQEPGTAEEIKEFCSANYNVTFPLFSKIEVNGDSRAPLYKWLIDQTDRKDIEWNFAKFLIARDGVSITRFPSKTDPASTEFQTAVRSALGV